MVEEVVVQNLKRASKEQAIAPNGLRLGTALLEISVPLLPAILLRINLGTPSRGKPMPMLLLLQRSPKAKAEEKEKAKAKMVRELLLLTKMALLLGDAPQNDRKVGGSGISLLRLPLVEPGRMGPDHLRLLERGAIRLQVFKIDLHVFAG